MRITLYHGTSGENAESILAAGLRASASGRLGKGVYFTSDRTAAERVANFKGGGSLKFVAGISIDSNKTKREYGCSYNITTFCRQRIQLWECPRTILVNHLGFFLNHTPYIHLTRVGILNPGHDEPGPRFVVTCEVDVGKVKDYGCSQDGSGSWRMDFDTAMSQHPPWAGNAKHFPEFCLADPTRAKITHVEGFVAAAAAGEDPLLDCPRYIINRAHKSFLHEHAMLDVDMDNPQWELRHAGAADTYYIVSHAAPQRFLDTHGEKVWPWGDGLNVGAHPENLQWRLRPVDGVPDTFYVINVGCSKFLDSHGGGVWVWGDGLVDNLDVGNKSVENLQWRFCKEQGSMYNGFMPPDL